MPTSLFFFVRLPTLLAIFWRAHLVPQAVCGGPQSEAPSFVIFRLDSLGDVVLTTPLFRALKQYHPKSRCTVVVEACYKPLLATNPHIDEILTLPKIKPTWLPRRARRLLSASLLYWTQLRKRQFDFAVSPRWDVDEHLATFLCALTSAAQRVGYCADTSSSKSRINRGFDAAFDIRLPAGPTRHEVLRNLAVGDALAATTGESRLEVCITDRDRRYAARLLARAPIGTRLIAIGIGARSPGRRWPLQSYADTLNQLGDMHRLQPVIICSAGEREEARKLIALLRAPTILVSGAGLREVCAVLERCELFLGNDSGPAHLAAAMECGVLVISRHPQDGDPNHCNSPIRFAPFSPHARILQPATGVDGCTTSCRAPAPHCITQVSVRMVVAAASQMLSAKPVARRRPQTNSQLMALSQRLPHTHSSDAVRRSLETLRPRVDRTLL